MINSLPDKLYSGAIVSYPENNEQGNHSLMQGIVAGIKELHKLLQVEKKFPKPEEELWELRCGAPCRAFLQEEYELLQLMQELQRQEYLKGTCGKVIPVLAGNGSPQGKK